MTPKPTHRYQISLLPYFVGNAAGVVDMVLPPSTHIVEGSSVLVENGQFYIKDALGSCVYSAPVDIVRYCIALPKKRPKHLAKVNSIRGDILI